MRLTIIILFASSSLLAQTFTVEKVSGIVTYQENGNEKWGNLEEGFVLNDNAIISTSENSTVQLGKQGLTFSLDEWSAISISSIKTMSIDDLLLALAFEDMLNAPKDIKESSDHTAVYGTREGETNSIQIRSEDFGIKRLNGAVRLAELGFQESAVVAAKETFRKYPDTKPLPGYRLYFANILYDKGLYEEALGEYKSISGLSITDYQKSEIEEKSEMIRKKLLND